MLSRERARPRVVGRDDVRIALRVRRELHHLARQRGEVRLSAAVLDHQPQGAWALPGTSPSGSGFVRPRYGAVNKQREFGIAMSAMTYR